MSLRQTPLSTVALPALLALGVAIPQPAQAAEDPFLGTAGRLFPHPVVSTRGSEPGSLLVGDFNEDGAVDLVAVGDIATAILLGNGDCSFRRSLIPGPGGVRGAIADFDEDNHQDLAIATGLEINVYLGNGDGTFGDALVLTAPPLSFFSFGILVADFDNDQHQDVLSGFYQGEPLTLLRGNGDGTFDAAASFSMDSVLGLCAADFNDDDNLDFIAGRSLPRVRLGNGDGTFVEGDFLAMGTDAENYVALDFDGDQIMDFATTNFNSGDVSVRLGNGDGTFGAAAHFAVGSFPRYISAHDLDQDGFEELVIASGWFTEQYVSILPGNGDGTFAAEVRVARPHSTGATAVADFDRDGSLDLAIASSFWDEVAIVRGQGDGAFEAPDPALVRSPAVADTTGFAFGDLNKDGLQDVVLLSDSAGTSIEVLVADGAGAFLSTATSAAGDQPAGATIVDIDNDTNPDIVVVNLADNTMTVLPGLGDGTFDPPFSNPAGRDPIAIASGYFTADGNVDLAILNTFPTPAIRIFAGNGDGSFSLGALLPVGATANQLFTADLDENTLPDLLAFDPQSFEIGILLGNGDGSFQPRVDYALPAAFGQDILNLVDVNDDGHLDLAFPQPDRNVLPGIGDGTFGTALQVGPDELTRAIATGDLNGDGRSDLVTGYIQIRTELRNPDGSLADPQFFSSDNTMAILIDDTNQDGRSDLITLRGDGVTVLLNIEAAAFNFLNDKTTLRWPTIPNAESYSLYRGALSALVDADRNGLPDSGYGECRNSLDPDPTDNTVEDAEVPAEGEGFFYLVAYLESGVEKSLGRTHEGLPREASVPCP